MGQLNFFYNHEIGAAGYFLYNHDSGAAGYYLYNHYNGAAGYFYITIIVRQQDIFYITMIVWQQEIFYITMIMGQQDIFEYQPIIYVIHIGNISSKSNNNSKTLHKISMLIFIMYFVWWSCSSKILWSAQSSIASSGVWPRSLPWTKICRLCWFYEYFDKTKTKLSLIGWKWKVGGLPYFFYYSQVHLGKNLYCPTQIITVNLHQTLILGSELVYFNKTSTVALYSQLLTFILNMFYVFVLTLSDTFSCKKRRKFTQEGIMWDQKWIQALVFHYYLIYSLFSEE